MKKRVLVLMGLWDTKATCRSLINKLEEKDYEVHVRYADSSSIGNYTRDITMSLGVVEPDIVIAQSTGCLALTCSLEWNEHLMPKQIILVSPLGFLRKQPLIKLLYIWKRLWKGINHVETVRDGDLLELKWLKSLFFEQKAMRDAKVKAKCTIVYTPQDELVNINKTRKLYKGIYDKCKEVQVKGAHNVLKYRSSCVNELV